VWRANGQLRTESNYKDGKQEGLERLWHDNGQLFTEATFKDDKRDGLVKWWHECSPSAHVGRLGLIE